MKVLLNKFSAVAIIQCIKEIGGNRIKFLLIYLEEANFTFYKRIPHLVFTHCDTGFHHSSVKKCTLCVYNTHVHVHVHVYIRIHAVVIHSVTLRG